MNLVRVFVCESGHMISPDYDIHLTYCQRCGNKVYETCPHCDSPIYERADLGSMRIHLSYYCHKCGSPLPWTQTILDRVTELLDTTEDIDDEVKCLIRSAFPGIITDEIPDTMVKTKFDRMADSIPKTLLNGLFNIAMQFGLEALKTLIEIPTAK